jgi:Flp pilus assembly protein TadG
MGTAMKIPSAMAMAQVLLGLFFLSDRVGEEKAVTVRPTKKERGAELIEFAMVLPLLLLMCLGVIEFGRVYYTYHILTKALRDGARYAATGRMNSDGTWVATETPSMTTKTQNVVVYGKSNPSGGDPKIIPNLATGDISVAPSLVSGECYVTVGAAYPYQPLFSLVIPATITLRPSVRMLFIGQLVFST